MRNYGLNKMDYFFDSYAIIEIINQNKSYDKFRDTVIITNLLHLAEVYYYFLRCFNEKTADYWISNLDFSFMDISREISIEAAKFKHKNKKQKLSYSDCIGYVTAVKNNMKFLTGDMQFKKMIGVEFVK